jgi:hypothetical protein
LTKRLVDDPRIARKERQRFTEIASCRTCIEIQSDIARIDLPREVEPEGLCRVLEEPALSDSRHAVGEAIALTRLSSPCCDRPARSNNGVVAMLCLRSTAKASLAAKPVAVGRTCGDVSSFMSLVHLGMI